MTYSIFFTDEAEKQFSKLPKSIKPKVAKLINGLVDEPIPHNAKKMAGYDTFYRIRFSEWRVVYEVLENELIIDVIPVGHRGTVYAKPL